MINFYKILGKKNTKNNVDFNISIPLCSDEQIKEILKHRTHYVPEAAQLAIDEAIKRGIIHSEQDLFAEEYKVEELKFSWFPKIRDGKNRKKIRVSIARSMVICGILPVVFGLVQMNKGIDIEGSLILFFGLIWIFAASNLIKQYHSTFVFSLMAGIVIAFLYMLYRISSLHNSSVFDYFLSSIVFILIVYGLVFIRRIYRE